MSNKRLLVDFDRVVHKYTHGWNDGTIYDEPVDGAIEAIKALQQEGYEVMIFTTFSVDGDLRNDRIREWLRKYGLHPMDVINTKLPARAIIDDRAIRFTNWRDVLNYFV